MEYNNLSKLIKKVLKTDQSGNTSMPSRREMTSKIFAFIMLIPGIISIVMTVASEGWESIFFATSASFFLSISILLFGRKSRLEFNVTEKQLNLKTALWGCFQRSKVVTSFDTLSFELSSIGAQGPYQIKFVDQLYEFKQYTDAKMFISFLNTKYNTTAVESISDWPNKTPIKFAQSELYSSPQITHGTKKANSKSHLEDVGFNSEDPVFIEIWNRKSLIKLSLPFFVFTAIAGLVKYGVL
ncbi:hypothetical protein EU510_04580 [Pseudoalteromonas sp. FUC4]|uniref:hypothetical protein n=1 Tax=Pseudoalteromonas sp. FUC4 TaxID=2511201 RepID=UPI0011F3AAE2|nr:hypothetical protein [Pseudoalteromonas sp. FUC4]KAA1155386.1 hypothetical protein EU510_04580 [Pseudoalteromonas sp. FUC4]